MPATTGGVDAGVDVTAWQYWWNFNREPYLRLKQRLGEEVTTGSDEFFLGLGQARQGTDRLRVSRKRIREEVVPALLAALDSERSVDVQSACMVALARIGDDLSEDGRPHAKIGERIVRRLDDSNQELAETAALALGILGDGRYAPLLGALLLDDRATLRAAGLEATSATSLRTRAFAAYGLGQLGSRLPYPQRPPLVETLQRVLELERDAAQPDVAMAAVAAIGLIPTDALRDAQENSPRAEQVRRLLKLYRDPSRAKLVRAHVPLALQRLLSDGPHDEALRREVLAQLCADLDEHGGESGALEQSAVLALGRLADCGGSSESVAARAALMRKATKDADEQVRAFALIALAQCAARPGEHRDWSGLAGTDSVRAFLVQRLSSGKVATRSWAGLALGVLERGLDDVGGKGSDATRGALVVRLDEASNPDEIGALAIACGLVGDRRAAPVLRGLLADIGDPEARGNVCVALGLLHDSGAKDSITALLERSRYQPALLQSAAIGLGLMGDRDVALQLIALLERAAGLASQASISSALGTIGDDRSVRPLLDLMQDQQKTALARAFAAAALGIVGDKDDLPWGSRYSIDVNYRANVATLIDPAGSLGLLNLL
ncbi:MAG TPA: HEAT repeat domain-containing protein [Planctomycetota bacterium]|nr:HEAT repeat domain-containing protein [Planctomycetota bacterium]